MSVTGSVLKPVIASVIGSVLDSGSGLAEPVDPDAIWFMGPAVKGGAFVGGSTLGPFDFSTLFGGTPTSYELINWPAGAVIDSAGVISGTWGAEGVYSDLQVKAIGLVNDAFTNGFAIALSASLEIQDPDYYALSYVRSNWTLVGVIFGFGNLIIDHANRYGKNNNNVYLPLATDQLIWNNAKYLNNHQLYSNNFTNAHWVKTNSIGIAFDATGLTGVTNTATTVYKTNGGQQQVHSLLPLAEDAVVVMYVKKDVASVMYNRMRMRYKTPDPKVDVDMIFRCSDGDIGSGTNVVYSVVDAGDWYKIIFEIDHPGNGFTELQTIFDPGHNLTGASAPVYTNSGSMVMGNVEIHTGSTIATLETVTWIITEGTGIVKGLASEDDINLLDPKPAVIYQPASTNYQLHSSRIIQNWVPSTWNPDIKSYVPSFIYGQTAAYLENTTGQYENLKYNRAVSVPVGSYVQRCFIKKTAGASGAFPEISLRFSSNEHTICQINTDTGVPHIRLNGLDATASVYEDIPGWWTVLLDGTNGTQGTYYESNVNVAYSPTATGDTDPTGKGSVTITQFEIYHNKPVEAVRFYDPAVTKTSILTRSATSYASDYDNNQDDLIAYYLEFTVYGDSNVLSDFLKIATNNVVLDDGVNTATAPIIYGTHHRVGFWTVGAEMQINVDGIWASITPYDGQLLRGTSGLFSDSEYPGTINDIIYWYVTDKANAISIIDQVMAA